MAKPTRNSKFDIRQMITDSIIQSMESAGRWQMPWFKNDSLPVNASTRKEYNGINTLMLWAYGQEYDSQEWATYKQWKTMGASVNKGEKGVPVVFYKRLMTDEEELEAELNGEKKPKFVLRYSTVFNADQVSGYTAKKTQKPPKTEIERIQAAEEFIKNTGAPVSHDGGGRAYYSPSTDSIHMPKPEVFTGSDTSSPQEAYYSTLLHELTHWTGHSSRCDRGLDKGSADKQAYAYEELCAELGAAFLCAELNISSHPREDHAAYLKGWLTLLKGDKTAIFRAAKEAQKAADFLHELQPKMENKASIEDTLADGFVHTEASKPKQDNTASLTM